MKPELVQGDSQRGEKQTCPRRAPAGVWPAKSDPSPGSAFLLIRTSGASRRCLPSSPPTPHPSSYLPFHSSRPVLVFSCCCSAIIHAFPPPRNCTQILFSLIYTWQQHNRGGSGCRLSLYSCCELHHPRVHLPCPSSLLHASLFTLSQKTTPLELPARRAASVFSLRRKMAQKHLQSNSSRPQGTDRIRL